MIDNKRENEMTKIEAHLPAREIKGNGKVFKYAAKTEVFEQDEQGRWINHLGFVNEEDVVSTCRKATNWSEIKNIHFPMVDFHY